MFGAMQLELGSFPTKLARRPSAESPVIPLSGNDAISYVIAGFSVERIIYVGGVHR